MSMRLEFFADDLNDLRAQLARTLSDITVNYPGISALGLNPAPSLLQSHWEAARKEGFRQGYERGLAEGMPGTYPRPEGMAADYPQAENQTGPYVNKPADCMDPHMPPADLEQKLAQQAEANRKTAVATGQARQEYYAEREGKQSMSSPEMVARSLAKQGRTLPGE
jgi:hypothetical protein